MKRVVFAIAAVIFLIVTGVIQASPTLADQKAPPAGVSQDRQTPPPPGVSPQDPAMDLPHMDGCCGACCCSERHSGAWHQKGRMGRPELDSGWGRHMEGQAPGQGPRAERSRPGRYGRAGDDACCAEGSCRMHRHFEGHGPRYGMHGRQDGPGPRAGFDGRGMRGGVEGMRGGNPAERLLRNKEELKLSDEQIATLEKLSFETQKTLVDLHAVIEKEQLEIRNLLQSGNDDLAAIKSHLSAVSQARADVQTARIANLFDAKKVLTEKQKKAIKEDFPRLGEMLD
jgi:Spy/CpxP family protein refolding chaperone